MKKFIYLLICIFLISSVSSISWSGGDVTIINQTINYGNGTTYTFNDTQFDSTGDYINILPSWLNLYIEDFLESMTTNIVTTGNVTAEYFIGDGSQLTGIQSEETDFKTYINGSAFNTIKYNLTAGDVEDIRRTIEPGETFIFGETFT